MFVRPIRSQWLSPARISISRTVFTRSKPSFPTTSRCPAPSCECAAMPVMPAGKEIDYSKPLNGTMAAYAEQVLVCTGKDDWSSRIEEEDSGDNLAADLKELLGRGGEFSDPYNNISVINSSFPSSISPRPEVITTSAYLVPSFKYIPFLPRVSFDSVQALVKGYLLPEKLDAGHDGLSPIHRDRLTRQEGAKNVLRGVKDIKDVLVLICGHGGRDIRCGILGPLLRDAFTKELSKKGFNVLDSPVEISPADLADSQDAISGSVDEKKTRDARIGLISHIGGHKFAGNVILYFPPGMKKGREEHDLAGCGVWYGRVEPKHVEGIVEETVLGGKVIEDMFRGGIRQGGDILRL